MVGDGGGGEEAEGKEEEEGGGEEGKMTRWTVLFRRPLVQ